MRTRERLIRFPSEGRLAKFFRVNEPSSVYFGARGGTTFGNERVGLYMIGIFHGIPLTAKGKILVRSLTLQHLVPVDALDEFFNCCSRGTSYVDSADEAAHAG